MVLPVLKGSALGLNGCAQIKDPERLLSARTRVDFKTNNEAITLSNPLIGRF